jgi:hypothetical protein
VNEKEVGVTVCLELSFAIRGVDSVIVPLMKSLWHELVNSP